MIRRATAADAAEVARVFLAARDEIVYLPPIPDADRAQLGGWIVERHEIWVAERDGLVVGFAGLDPGELSHLYVEPAAQNAGLGTALLDHAKALSGGALQLWVFQRNAGARRFYERNGFRLVRLTDGADNMEGEPDALYAWRGVSERASAPPTRESTER